MRCFKANLHDLALGQLPGSLQLLETACLSGNSGLLGDFDDAEVLH